MYLGTGDLISLLVALICALITIALGIKVNAELTKENQRLRYRNRELTKQVHNG